MHPSAPVIALGSAALALGLAAPVAAQKSAPAPVTAQQAAPAPRYAAPPPRARGPALDVAVALAQSAIRTCLDHGYKTAVLVVDSQGVPVAMLSADGAVAIAQDIARRKVAVVIRYKVPSGAIAERVKIEPALAAEVKADPAIGFALAGALPLTVGGEQIGAFAVSGASGPDQDEACASAALASMAGKLR